MVQGIYRGTTPSITLQVTGVDLSFLDTWPVVVVTLKNGDTEIDVQRDLLDIRHADTGSIKREIQAGRDVAFWLDKAYTHLGSGLFDEDDIA